MNKNLKLVSMQTKRRGQRGKMYYVVFVKGPEVPPPHRTISFESRDEAARMVHQLVEAEGYQRTHIKKFLSSETTLQSLEIVKEAKKELQHNVAVTAELRARNEASSVSLQVEYDKAQKLMEEFQELRQMHNIIKKNIG